MKTFDQWKNVKLFVELGNNDGTSQTQVNTANPTQAAPQGTQPTAPVAAPVNPQAGPFDEVPTMKNFLITFMSKLQNKPAKEIAAIQAALSTEIQKLMMEKNKSTAIQTARSNVQLNRVFQRPTSTV